MSVHKTWIVVADAAHARVYELARPGGTLHHLSGLDLAESVPPAAEVHRHEPGTGHTGVGSARHGVGPTSDPRREMKRHFADRVAAGLEAARASHAFDRLVIAAPPAMLGDLRSAMPPALRNLVVAEVAKDLVKTPKHELPAHFAHVPAVSG